MYPPPINSFCGKLTAVDLGKLGRELDVGQGYGAARNVAISALATMKYALGELSKVKRIVRVPGMVNATEDVKEHPGAINGISDLMVKVSGPKGKHLRSALERGSLPGGVAVEAEVTVEEEQ